MTDYQNIRKGKDFCCGRYAQTSEQSEKIVYCDVVQFSPKREVDCYFFTKVKPIMQSQCTYKENLEQRLIKVKIE